MRIFRIVLLGLAMALFAINFWAIDYQDLWGKNSQWAYLRTVSYTHLTLPTKLEV